MAWIKTQQDLKDHYKTRRLARMLKRPVPDVIGRLHLLWCWALRFAPDGDLSCFDAEDIADIVMWEDDPQTFLDALVDCGGKRASGFVDRGDDGSLTLHDWEENCDTEYQKKAGDAKRQQKVRARRALSQPDLVTSQEGHTDVTPFNCDGGQMSQPENMNGIEIKDTPIGAADAAVPQRDQPTAQDGLLAPTEAPHAFKQAADYLLLKTGRKGLTEAEIAALRTLNASHSPARVMAEIDKAVERYKRKNRPLSSLTFVYIADSLCRQTSRPQTHPAGPLSVSHTDSNEPHGIPDDEYARLEAKFSDKEEAA